MKKESAMSEPDSNPEKRIALFQRKEVHRVIHNNEWWFVITDVVTVLTDSVDASDYLKKLRKRDPSLSETFKGGGQIAPPLQGLCPNRDLVCASSSNNRKDRRNLSGRR